MLFCSEGLPRQFDQAFFIRALNITHPAIDGSPQPTGADLRAVDASAGSPITVSVSSSASRSGAAGSGPEALQRASRLSIRRPTLANRGQDHLPKIISVLLHSKLLGSRTYSRPAPRPPPECCRRYLKNGLKSCPSPQRRCCGIPAKPRGPAPLSNRSNTVST